MLYSKHYTLRDAVTALLSMRKDSVDAQPVAILASGFSRRHTLLLVQTDAWDRYGERATLCFEFGAAGQGRQQSRKRGSCGRADDLSKR
jgi:hypothetical protein